MNSQQLSVSNTQRHVILSRRMSLSRAASRERIYLNNHPPLGGFLIFYICALIFNMNVKMQNKAKLKSPKMPATPYRPSTNKTTLHPPQPKNKAKQTQTKVAQASCLRVTPASSRQLKTKIVNPVILSKENPVNPVKHKKMTSKPNFSSSQICHKLLYIKKLGFARTLDKQKKANPIEPNFLDFRPKIRFFRHISGFRPHPAAISGFRPQYVRYKCPNDRFIPHFSFLSNLPVSTSFKPSRTRGLSGSLLSTI